MLVASNRKIANTYENDHEQACFIMLHQASLPDVMLSVTKAQNSGHIHD